MGVQVSTEYEVRVTSSMSWNHVNSGGNTNCSLYFRSTLNKILRLSPDDQCVELHILNKLLKQQKSSNRKAARQHNKGRCRVQIKSAPLTGDTVVQSKIRCAAVKLTKAAPKACMVPLLYVEYLRRSGRAQNAWDQLRNLSETDISLFHNAWHPQGLTIVSSLRLDPGKFC
eukprot:gb/GECG01002620.1/.p1 GENE.gb/GECG01002620.1/~~gb/GECG01002620.1/.p1  ORF type:complete len:171 (+),score=12.20 gb/GECG01002620.1/:1-513(+)